MALAVLNWVGQFDIGPPRKSLEARRVIASDVSELPQPVDIDSASCHKALTFEYLEARRMQRYCPEVSLTLLSLANEPLAWRIAHIIAIVAPLVVDHGLGYSVSHGRQTVDIKLVWWLWADPSKEAVSSC